MSDSAVSHARRVNNLPKPRERQHWAKQILTSPWTWTLLAALVVFAGCVLWFLSMMMADVEVPGGVMPGINGSAIRDAARYATPTLLFWVVVFLIADRFRPQRPLVWFLALGWGGTVAVVISAEINTWAAAQMNVSGDGNPASAARAAIFIAPFVEEAAKATVLFWLAIMVRNRLVSKVTMVTLGGLSAVGFAFTENILYYAQAIVYSAQTIDVGDAEAAVNEIVWLRGFWTCFGHPLFTIMTGIGIAVALRTRSKVVRILAPLAGYLGAALLHMVFNSQASQRITDATLFMYFLVVLPFVVAIIVFVVRQILAQGRLIRARLDDYVRAGWLHSVDPIVFGRFRTRVRAAFIALTKGWSTFLVTLALQSAMTELAYLRDSETSGLVDATSNVRAGEILLRIRSLRPRAISDPRGMRISWPRIFPRKGRIAIPPDGTNYSRPAQLTPTGPSAGYSAVDPTWAPPPG